MKKLLFVLLIIFSFFIGCGEKSDTNENKKLEQKYEKMHRAKWKERQKERGSSYTYKQYLMEEAQKELDNPTYKIVSLKHCDIPVRDFVEFEEGYIFDYLNYVDDSYNNKFVQYYHGYSINVTYKNEASFIGEVKAYNSYIEDNYGISLQNHEYNNFKIYTHGSYFSDFGVGNTYLVYGSNININIGNTTEKEIKYMIDYCNKTKKE